MASSDAGPWPELPDAAWRDTRETLHLWTQIVGKIRLAQTPWLNHSWHVRALCHARAASRPRRSRYGGRAFEIEFDFIDHALVVRDERAARSPPAARADAGRAISTRELMAALARARLAVTINDDAQRDRRSRIPFDQDRIHAAYDADYAASLLARAALRRDDVLRPFPHRLSRQGEPGAFLLGQLRPGGHALFRPARAAASRRRAASARRRRARSLFARGVERRLLARRRRPIDDAAFYSYAYPAPEGFARGVRCSRPRPCFSKDARRVHPALRRRAHGAGDPDATLLAFLQSTYDAAADLGRWDRAALECPLGEPGRPRPMS